MWQLANQNCSKMQNFKHPHLLETNLLEQVKKTAIVQLKAWHRANLTYRKHTCKDIIVV